MIDAAELTATARERADELPGSEPGHPFGAEWLVYKVRGKVFLLLADMPDEGTVTLKAHPVDCLELCAQYTDIRPGYHMNKRHWISVTAGPSVDAELVADLVLESYLRVLEGIPRRDRPVDPTTFGRGEEPLPH